MFYYNLGNYIRKPYINRNLSNNLIAQMLRDVKAYMVKYFNKTNVRLGEYQKLVRGDKEIPIWGDIAPEVSSNPKDDIKLIFRLILLALFFGIFFSCTLKLITKGRKE